MSFDFWSGRRVLITGHTGFKGAWMTRWLMRLGAHVHGLALAPSGTPNLFELLKPWRGVGDSIVDLEDPVAVGAVVKDFAPEIVLHMAAQSLVPRSYREPTRTWRTNVMGTVHLLEALSSAPALRAVLVVTSDKVYRNDEGHGAFREADELGGDDPYSASKAATELVVNSWRRSFFTNKVPIGTARAGNIIGGGDWAENRLVPDAVRAIAEGRELVVRNPDATRPWQHVLDPLFGYLLYMERQATASDAPSALNFGPTADQPLRVREVVERLIGRFGNPIGWRHVAEPGMPEKHNLELDASEARRTLGWHARLDVEAALDWTSEWYAAWHRGEDPVRLTDGQIDRYTALVS